MRMHSPLLQWIGAGLTLPDDPYLTQGCIPRKRNLPALVERHLRSAAVGIVVDLGLSAHFMHQTLQFYDKSCWLA
jgi:hypothetical protein